MFLYLTQPGHRHEVYKQRPFRWRWARRGGGSSPASCGDPMEENRMYTRGVRVSAIAIIILLGFVALAALPAALAAGPPTRPLALQSSAGDAAVTISWLAPASDGGSAITGYKVYRGTIAGGESLLVTLGDVRTYFDSGLINGRTYYYQVGAMNANGDGILSNEVSATPPQVVGIPWVSQFGAVASANDFVRGLAVDTAGEYVAGDTLGTLPGQTRVGGLDAFLGKYDADGTVTWTVQFGTVLDDSAVAVAVDASGVYVAGQTLGALPGQTNAGNLDAYLQKYDTAGNLLWTRQVGTPSEDAATAIVTSASGVYLAGYTWDTLPGQANVGFNDVFLQKYDANGTVQWTRECGTWFRDSAFALAVAASGAYVAGYATGILRGQTSAGGQDMFLRKYDADGAILWTRQFGTSQVDYAYGVAVDASGVYVGGWTAGTFPGETNAGSYDALLRKYDADGAVLWTHQFGTSSYEYCCGVAVDASGVYVGGATGDAFPGQTNAGNSDALLRKYDPDGSVLWTREFGTSGGEVYFSNTCCQFGPIAVDASGMYFAGSTSGTFPGQTNSGGTDAFLAALVQIPAEPPGPAANLQAAAGDGKVDLSWYQPASDGRSPVTNYRIYRGTTSGSLTFLSMIGTVLSYADTGRTNGVTYYYAVSAVNAAGEGAQSGEVSATPMGTGTAPSAAADSPSPTIAITSPVANSVLTSTSVTVTGTAADDVAVEKVELSTDGTTWTRATGTTSWSGTVILQAGSNVIYARATDTSRNQQTSQVSVTAQVARPGPATLDLMLLAGIGGAIAIAISYTAFRVVVKSKREKKEKLPPPPPQSSGRR